MAGRHFSSEELIGILYGIDLGGEHIQECPACAAQLAGMRERRRASLGSAGFTDAELATQTRRWRDRVAAEQPRPARSWWPWRLAAVSAGLLALTIAVLPPSPRVSVPDDARLFEDAFQKAVSVEPDSFAPIENLFERNRP